jgi:hypothetical protein
MPQGLSRIRDQPPRRRGRLTGSVDLALVSSIIRLFPVLFGYCVVNARGPTEMKKLTIGRAREWVFLLVALCVAILVLIGVFTWLIA